MLNQKWKPYSLWILFAVAVGLLSGLLSADGTAASTREIVKPPLSPPALLFPVVWTVLYVLMGISAARVSLTAPSRQRGLGLNLFVLQLAVNFFWSIIFFNMGAFGFAFVWLVILWVLVLWMILTFGKTDPLAAWLQIPYLIWLTFAAYLSAGIWLLNG